MRAPSACVGCGVEIVQQDRPSGRRKRFCTRLCYFSHLTATGHAKAQRRKKYEAGTCASCTLPALDGFRSCERHLDIQKEKNWAYRERRRGLCRVCGGAGGPTCGTCRPAARAKHNAAARRLYHLRAFAGLCPSCGIEGPKVGGKLCQRCLARARFQHALRRFRRAVEGDRIYQRNLARARWDESG